MVDGSAQRGAPLCCSCIGRERGFGRWGCHRECVVVQGEGVGDVSGCVRVLCYARASVFRICFALRPLPLSCAPLQDLLLPMLLMCTTVQLGHGRRLSSASSAIILQLHRSGTWFCSLGVALVMRCCVGSCCLRILCYARAAVFWLCFALRPLHLSCAPLQVVVILMLWMCTTVQQGHGRRLSSAWRAFFLQLHRSGTWLCSLGVPQEVRCCAGRGGGRCFWLRSCFVLCACCSILVMFCPATASSLMRATTGRAASNVVDIYCNSTSAAACQALTTTASPSTTAPATTAASPPSTTAPATTTAPSTSAPATTAASPPSTSPSPSPPPPPPPSLPCTDSCGSCCCPGCHAINGSCYACAAGSYSSDCSNHTQSTCRVCPSGFFCPEGAIQPYLPAVTLAVIIACVVLADLVLACVFFCTKRLSVAGAKGWILAALIFGPFVWFIWWYKHRDVGASQLSEPLLLDHSLQNESTAVDSSAIDHASHRIPSRNDIKQHLKQHQQQHQQPAASGAPAILKPIQYYNHKPSAPPLDDQDAAAVVQPVSSYSSAEADVSPICYIGGQKASQALDLDQPSDDMMDQCPPSPPLSPAPLTMHGHCYCSTFNVLLRMHKSSHAVAPQVFHHGNYA
jgi:hypothetical protein